MDVRKRGPFAFQSNNSTREFEYPWAYQAVVGHSPNSLIFDVGGSVGGMQYVFATEGHQVVNIDPGMDAEGLGWELSSTQHVRLSECFSAPVKLIGKTIQDAGIQSDYADVVMCISALEHFSPADSAAAAANFARVLKPGGIAVLTIDLFLDLEPFTDRKTNEFGCNLNVKQWLEQAGLELHEGLRSELNGFPEFSPNSILSDLARYHVGRNYPALAQCLVVRKRPRLPMTTTN